MRNSPLVATVADTAPVTCLTTAHTAHHCPPLSTVAHLTAVVLLHTATIAAHVRGVGLRRTIPDPSSMLPALRLLSAAHTSPAAALVTNFSPAQQHKATKRLLHITSAFRVASPASLLTARQSRPLGSASPPPQPASSSMTTSSTSSAASTSSTSPDSSASSPHLSLPSLTSTSRILFVGDVHGCYDELRELISAANIRLGEDAVILTGDLVAKGPKPLEVLRFVRGTPCVYSVMGNHDHHVVRAIVKREEKPLPSPVPPYEEQPHEHVAATLTADERRWYSNLPLTISLPSLSPPHVVVHAGVMPGVAWSEQDPFLLMNLRNITDDGRGIKGKKEGVNWVERWHGPEKVVFGHAAARGLQQPESGWALGLDSGCCYGKQLSGWLLPEGRLVQVPAQRVYEQPDHERGAQ